MEPWVFIVLLVIAAPLFLAIWLIVRAIKAGNRISELSHRLSELELEVLRLRKGAETAHKPEVAPVGVPNAKVEPTPTSVQPPLPPVIQREEIRPVSPPLSKPAVVPPGIPPPIPRVASTPAPPPIPPPLFASSTQPLPATPASQSQTAPPPIAEKGSFEMRLGTYWLVRIGAVLILTGLVFFGNLAYQKMGDAGKVALLYLTSGLLLGTGAWWQRKSVKESLQNYAQVLFAGGLAAVYFTTYAAHHVAQLRVIESAALDGALLLAWAGFMAWIADRRKSEVLALFAVGLAYYTSVITHVGSFTLYSNLVLTLVAVVFLVRNRWAGLSYASLVATYASYAFWRFFHGGDWRWASPEEGLWFGTYFLMSYWLVFTAAVFLSKHEKFAGQNRAAFLTLNNGAFFALFVLTMVQTHSGGFWKLSLSYGAVLLVLTDFSRRLLPAEPLTKNAYLTQGLLLVTIGIISKFAGLQLALLLAAESVVLFVLGTQRGSLILKIGAYIAGALSVSWCFDGLETFDTRGLWLGSAVGALMAFNSFWAHRQNATSNSALRPVPGYFTVLALTAWFATTWHNTTSEYFPLLLAVEATVLTLSIYLLRVREITLLGQGYLIIAQMIWMGRFADSPPVTPWWHHGLMIALLLGLSHWWQHQKILASGRQLRSVWQGLYALAIVGALYFWLLQTVVSAPIWLALSSALAVAITAYGVATRAWLLALCGQFFLLFGAGQFVVQLLRGKPEWYFPITPIAVLALLSFATVRWFATKADSDPKVRDPLLVLAQVYRWVALAMSVCWIFKYVPDRVQICVFAAIGLLIFILAGWLKKREALLFGAVFSALAVLLVWTRCLRPELIYLPNALAILALLGQQQIAQRLPARYNLSKSVHAAVILIGGLTLWLFVSRWVLRSASGFYLTASWSGLALALFTCSMVLRERMYRWLGLGVLAAALGRVVVFDVWKLETNYRILSFMALGIVLLVLGFIYNKYQEKIRQWL